MVSAQNHAILMHLQTKELGINPKVVGKNNEIIH